MHGNNTPSLLEPSDLAQVDRVNPVHFPMEYGDLHDPDHVWDELVAEAKRIQEDPTIKQLASTGAFASELFCHCAEARQCIRSGERKIEPRPPAVIAATVDLMVNTGVQDLRSLIARFCATYLEPRESVIETWTEVKYGLKLYLQRVGFDLGHQQLGSYLGDFNVALGGAGVPRGHPTTFRIWGSGLPRGGQPIVKRRMADGAWVKYGLNQEGRQLVHEAMCAHALVRMPRMEPPPAPLTNIELIAIVEAGCRSNTWPERYQPCFTART